MKHFLINKNSIRFLCSLPHPKHLDQWREERGEIRGVCFCGRSNVGKSSLINALFSAKQAKTAKSPGKTRDIVVFTFSLTREGENLGPFYLFDLPGYGFARVSKLVKKRWEALMESFFAWSLNQCVIACIQDARHPMEKNDLIFEDFLGSTTQKKILIFNKIDKLKATGLYKLKKEMPQGRLFLSARSKEGLGDFERLLTGLLTAP